MKFRHLLRCSAVVCVLLAFAVLGAAQEEVEPLVLPVVEESVSPPYFRTRYVPPAEPEPGELRIAVDYTLWVPEDIKKVRGIIVHQHGCGEGACRGSVTAAYDLHWQELARRNGCALLGPSFRQRQEQDCQLWCDARNGSAEVFLECLEELAELSGRPEVATAPWCLWGHSGGGTWASWMLAACPERIVAIWFQSGTAFGRGEMDASGIADAMLSVPMMANPGEKERTHERFHRAWDGSLAMFRAYRAKGAPFGFAPDPRTGHEAGDSRYLAIPFFEACLRLRLPDRVGEPLKPVDVNEGWLAPVLSTQRPLPGRYFEGDAGEAVWLPSEDVARAWHDFVRTGTVADGTPPPAPTDVEVDAATGTVTWNAAVDFESGLQAFVIERDGEEIGRVPERARGRFGRALFQGLSYGDTPELPLGEFRFVDEAVRGGELGEYRVVAVNGAGLLSGNLSSE